MRILFFGHLRDVTRCAEMEVHFDESADADAVWCKLIESHPALARFRSSVRLARNCEYAGVDAHFADADEVALIPPVSGG